LKTGHRYAAAQAAALAGCGKGKDASRLDDPARARWRRQALAWLKADLAEYAKRLESGQPADRRLVEERLRQWQRDGDLAGVRDPGAVGKLPAEEQGPWRALWAEVEALLEKSQR
jgi:hypothetical protein